MYITQKLNEKFRFFFSLSNKKKKKNFRKITQSSVCDKKKPLLNLKRKNFRFFISLGNVNLFK